MNKQIHSGSKHYGNICRKYSKACIRFFCLKNSSMICKRIHRESE